MKQFKLILLLTVILAAFFLTSCGDPSTSSGSDDDDEGIDPDDDDDDVDDDLDDDTDDDPDDDDDADDDDMGEPDPAIQAMIDEYINFTGEPGIAIAWRREGESLRVQTAGVADIETQEPLDEDNIYRIGSCTKPFVVALIMQLVDEGLIGLDDPLGDFFPQYSQWIDVTIRQLAAMRSGIPDYLGSYAFWLYSLMHLEEPFTPLQVVEYAVNMDMEFEPGEDCNYSNTNYVLLGMIIEHVTGNSAAQELHDRIFAPLGLSSTFLDDEGEVLPDLAHGYADAELAGPVLGVDEILQLIIDFVPDIFIIDGLLMDATYMLHPTFAWTSGAMVSSPRDLAKFMRAWVRGELASEESMDEVLDFTECTIMGGGVQYGLGMEEMETDYGVAMGHGGLHFGYSTTNYYIPESDVNFTINSNFLPDQNWSVVFELLQHIHEGPLTPEDVCTPPDNFFDAQTEGLFQLRFRGILNPEQEEGDDDDDEDEMPGLSGSRLRLNNEWRAYYGYGAEANIEEDELLINSTGPGRNGDWDRRHFTVELGDNFFNNLDENGYAEIANDRLDLFSSFLWDIAFDPEPEIYVKFCVFATADLEESSEFYFCGDSAFLNPGETLKVFANIPMTADISAVDEYLEHLELPHCLCVDYEGDMTPC